MTTSVRSLALLTAILACACSDKEPARTVKPKLDPSAQAARTDESAPMPAPAALTATAEAAPRSIVDAPKEPAPAPVAEERTAIPAHAPEPEGPADLARPLSAEEVHVSRFLLTTGVEGREPLDDKDTFATGTEKIFAFVELENRDGAPYVFDVHFEPADGPALPYGIALKVPTAERYRTWAFTRIKREPGLYRAVLRTPDGAEIASRVFTVSDADETLHDEPADLTDESADAARD